MGLEAPAVHLLLVIPVLLVILALAPPSRRSIVPAAHFFEGEDLLVDPDGGGGRRVEVEDHVVSLDGEELGVMGGRTAQSIFLENRWGRESMSYERVTRNTHITNSADES